MYRKGVMIGNVVIPTDVERERYVSYAIRTNTVCVITADGDFMKNCPVVMNFCGYNDGWFNTMEYPNNSFELGTQVVLLNLTEHDIPVVVGCLNPRQSTTTLNEEFQFNISRKYELDKVSGSVTIEGKGLSGVLNLLVKSSEESGGKINICSKNEHESGEIILRTNNFKIYGNKTVDILSDENVLINVGYLDGETTKQHKLEINQDTISITHNDGQNIVVSKEDIVMNGGDNGGLTKINTLLSKINQLENIMNTHIHTGNLGAPTTPQLTPIAPITLLSDLENKKVKH